MVKLEWQNALYKSTKGICKIVPVRVDGSEMPAILMQNLYIDLFAHGIETTIVQIVNVIQGNNTFTPQYLGFSNLTYKIDGDLNSFIKITISASHLMEPNPEFIILFSNEQSEVKIEFENKTPSRGGYNKDIKLNDGTVTNGMVMAPLGGAITPTMPMKIIITANSEQPIDFNGVLHRSSYEEYTPIPQVA